MKLRVQINKIELNKILNGQIGDVNIIRAMKSQNHINKSKKTDQPTLRELVLQLVSDVSYIKDVLKRNNLK